MAHQSPIIAKMGRENTTCMRAVATTVAAAAAVTWVTAVRQRVMTGGVRCMVT